MPSVKRGLALRPWHARLPRMLDNARSLGTGRPARLVPRHGRGSARGRGACRLAEPGRCARPATTSVRWAPCTCRHPGLARQGRRRLAARPRGRCTKAAPAACGAAPVPDRCSRCGCDGSPHRGAGSPHARRAARRRSPASTAAASRRPPRTSASIAGRSTGAPDADRRGARARRGPARPSPSLVAPDSCSTRCWRPSALAKKDVAHHQHRLLAPAGKPHAHAAGGAGVPSIPGAAGGAGRPGCGACCSAAPRPSTFSTFPKASCAFAASSAT